MINPNWILGEIFLSLILGVLIIYANSRLVSALTVPLIMFLCVLAGFLLHKIGSGCL